jgi:hypothetical protein
MNVEIGTEGIAVHRSIYGCLKGALISCDRLLGPNTHKDAEVKGEAGL